MSIPPPLIPLLIFPILLPPFHSFPILNIKLHPSFIQHFFILPFFTTIPLPPSFKLFKLPPKLFLLYFIFSPIISLIQNILPLSLPKLLNIKPFLPLTPPSIS
ncbi:sodium/glutamate symporter, partial [Staphylococcus aureus]|uniref:sodium/glutamate symporter n=1 Tax=Staphylococcus aureus TaxID=1280 RepID=UPI0037DA3227